jgi:hypothetical protein
VTRTGKKNVSNSRLHTERPPHDVFLFGGIDGQQFVVAQLLTVATALAVSAVSLFLSTLFRRTLAATVVAYAVTFGATAASWFTGMTLLGGGHIRASQVALFANPIQAILTVLRGPGGLGPPGLTPVRTITYGAPFAPAAAGPTFQPWLLTVGVELALVVLAAAGTILLLRERRGLGRRA